ncbi:hypothetical protein Tco_0435518 [Tanacetum coccineum]
MFMTIQSSVKDKILATLSETSKVENAPAEMLCDLDQQMEKRANDGCTYGLNCIERVKPRRVRAMAMTIQYGVRGMMLAAQSEAFKQENGMMRTVVMDEAHASRYLVHPGADKTYYNLGDMYCLRYWSENEIESPWILSVNFPRSPVLWAVIGESSLIGPELVQETTDKVVLIKEKLKAARDRQKSYANNRHKPLEFKVEDWVMLKVSPCKGVVSFGKKGKFTLRKKGKLAMRYVGLFEILKRIGLVAYRLRLPEELNSVYDTFHVSNLKKYLANANLHVPLNEIKVDKTLCFVEEPVEIMDREIRKLKHRKIVLVIVRWNSKRDPEFTWEHEDQMRIKYPQLFVDRVLEPAS